MTLLATARTGEIGAAGFRISRLKIGNVHRTASAAQRFCLRFLIVNERDDGPKIRRTQIEWRHSLLGPALKRHRTDLVSTHVFRNQDRAGEIGPRFAARRIASMTETALRPEARLACLYLFGGISLRRCGLRRPL